VKSLGDASVSFKDLTANANDTVKAQLRLTDATEALNKYLVKLFRNTSTFTTELKADLFEIAVVYLKKVVNTTIQLSNFFIDLYNNSTLFRLAVQAVVLNFKNLWEIIKLVGNTLINTFTSAGKLFKAVITGNFADIPNIIKESVTNSTNTYKTFGSNFADNFIDAANNTFKNKKIELITDEQIVRQVDKAKKSIQKGLATVDYGKVSIKTVENKPTKPFSMNDLPIDGKRINLAKDTADVKALTSAWDGFGSAVKKNVGNVAVNAIDALGSTLATLATGQEVTFGSFVKTVLQGITQIIKGFIAQAIAAQIAANSAFGLPGLILAGIGIAAVETLVASIPAFANGVNNFGGGMALVGERGAELVNLPRGSSVYSNSKSKSLLDNMTPNKLQVEVVGSISGNNIYLANAETVRRRNNSK
jgi:hypothetical protein